ncbi:MAG TPA: DUF1326 domain-containing protein [Candidatus Methylomirabilis sp.]|nr:DUF1326 domain-containing protein [Candidatus Methylomirabilis sp.]
MAEPWSLKGTYFETCNCEVACPCVFLSPPTTGECTVLVGWHIEQGRYASVALDGLNVALAVHVPGHMAATKWKAAVYFDDRASDGQKNALLQIFTGQAGGHPAVLASFVGQVLGVKSVPIEYRAEGKRRRLRIAGIADAEIEALSGAGGADVTVSGHPLCIAPGFAATVARSKHLSYQDHGLHWEVSEKNGFFSPFAYQAG